MWTQALCLFLIRVHVRQQVLAHLYFEPQRVNFQFDPDDVIVLPFLMIRAM